MNNALFAVLWHLAELNCCTRLHANALTCTHVYKEWGSKDLNCNTMMVLCCRRCVERKRLTVLFARAHTFVPWWSRTPHTQSKKNRSCPHNATVPNVVGPTHAHMNSFAGWAPAVWHLNNMCVISHSSTQAHTNVNRLRSIGFVYCYTINDVCRYFSCINSSIEKNGFWYWRLNVRVGKCYRKFQTEDNLCPNIFSGRISVSNRNWRAPCGPNADSDLSIYIQTNTSQNIHPHSPTHRSKYPAAKLNYAGRRRMCGCGNSLSRKLQMLWYSTQSPTRLQYSSVYNHLVCLSPAHRSVIHDARGTYALTAFNLFELLRWGESNANNFDCLYNLWCIKVRVYDGQYIQHTSAVCIVHCAMILMAHL